MQLVHTQGIYPQHEFYKGGYPPHQLNFFGKFFSGFEKCNFKAFRSKIIKHFKVLKTHQGGYFHFKKNKTNIFF
jgi:hypothetical protein